MPELGALDRCVYALLIALTLLGAVLMVPVFLTLENRIPFDAPAVVAYSNRMGILGVFLACILMVLVISALIGGCTRKFPIFGAAGVPYGGPEWTPVYPLLMPTRDVPEQVRRDVREGRQIAALLLAGVLLAGVVFGVSLLSGNRLDGDGGIRWLWGFGWECEHYEPEDVEQVTVVISRVGSNRGLSTKRCEIVLDIQTADERVHSFFLRDFRKNGDSSQVALLKQVLECYDGAQLLLGNGHLLEELFCDQQYSPEDMAILGELFE